MNRQVVPERELVIRNLSRLNITFEWIESLQTSPHGWKKGNNLFSGGAVGDLKFSFKPPLTIVEGWVRSEMTANLHYGTSCTVLADPVNGRSLQAFTCVCEGTTLLLHFLCFLFHY